MGVRPGARARGVGWEASRLGGPGLAVHARRGSAHGLWIIWADGRERDRLRELMAHSRRGAVGYPASMTKPNVERKGSDDSLEWTPRPSAEEGRRRVKMEAL